MTTALISLRADTAEQALEDIGTVDAVTDLLDDLGATRWAVAETLFRAGHFGHRMSRATCPVAEYLRAHGYDVIMDHRNVEILDGRSSGPVASIPPAVQGFIRAFDTSDTFWYLKKTGSL